MHDAAIVWLAGMLFVHFAVDVVVIRDFIAKHAHRTGTWDAPKHPQQLLASLLKYSVQSMVVLSQATNPPQLQVLE